MEFLSNINYSKKYCSTINESKYTQSIQKVVNKVYDKTNSYKTLEEVIIYSYDHNSLLNDNTNLYIDQYKLKIASNIDENSKNFYDNYKYSKKMKKNLIQCGLQSKNNISSIIYLGDLFKIDIVVKVNDNYYKIADRNREDYFVEYKDGLWRNIKVENYVSQKTLDDLESILKFNINVNDIYIKYLKPISNYKIQELIDIAQSKNIDIKINGKKRTKLDLYNEINIKVIV